MRISDWSSDVCSSDLATSVATLSIGPSAMPRYSAACNGITPKTGSTMTYRAPTTEQLFVLNHIARIDAMAAHERFAAATPDTVEETVAGIGDFPHQSGEAPCRGRGWQCVDDPVGT